MNEKLEQKLFDKFPKIFQKKDLDMSMTCMCWGIDTPDSWYNIIQKLCEKLQWDTDNNNYPQVVAEQVKEKFGTLRFYYGLDNIQKLSEERLTHNEGYIEGVVSVYEDITSGICSECGSNKDVTSTRGWVRYLCGDCMGELNAERNKM